MIQISSISPKRCPDFIPVRKVNGPAVYSDFSLKPLTQSDELRFSGKKLPKLTGRRVFYSTVPLTTAIIEAVATQMPEVRLIAYPLLSSYTSLGVYDMLQKKHSIWRNYPVWGRLRPFIEDHIRPKARQYLWEPDIGGDGQYDRADREEVYRLSKDLPDVKPFGSKRDMYKPGHKIILHSFRPLNLSDPTWERTFKPKNAQDTPTHILIGKDRKQPYLSSRFNISGMSYGALGKNAVVAMYQGAAIAGCAQSTGEGGLTPYHLGADETLDINHPDFDYDQWLDNGGYQYLRPLGVKGLIQKAKIALGALDPALDPLPKKRALDSPGDVIWQIGTGYFGCRNPDGTFNPKLFAKMARLNKVKMIELKMSQGAKPGHGGILPKAKLTPGIAKIRRVPMGQDVHSPGAHSAFNTPKGMLYFVQQLRELSGDKPVGIKLCVGNRQEFLALCKAMVDTGIKPDYMTIDGGEGGTGAAPTEFMDSVGMPLQDAVLFVRNALVGFGLYDDIPLIASGKVTNGMKALSLMAMGVKGLGAARAMMFATGCIMADKCDTNACPTGVTTHDDDLQAGLVVEDKKKRIANFHKNLMRNYLDLLGVIGLEHPDQLQPRHIQRRMEDGKFKSLAEVDEYLQPGVLLIKETVPESFRPYWAMASAETFAEIAQAV